MGVGLPLPRNRQANTVTAIGGNPWGQSLRYSIHSLRKNEKFNIKF